MYANIAIQAVPGSADAHYWLVYAMQHLGTPEIARNQLHAAKQALTEDDYADVLKRLNIADTASIE